MARWDARCARPHGLTGQGHFHRLWAASGADQTLLVEVDDPNVGNQPVARGVAERAQDTFETAIAQIKPGVEALMAQLRDLSAKPESISLEFGIKFTAGADALIAKTSVEGNVKVTLNWKPQ